MMSFEAVRERCGEIMLATPEERMYADVLDLLLAVIESELHQVPMGHLPMIRSFGTPIVYRGELIGQFHFANRATDYTDDDVRLLERTCEFIAPVLNARLRHGAEQHKRARLQEELVVTTLQLRNKVEELERLNAALIDREERMIELKRELARLKGTPKE